MQPYPVSTRSADASKGQYQKNNTIPFSMDSLFKTALNRGIITIDDVMNSAKEDIMKTILDTVHRFAIKRLSDGRYCTYIPDENKPGGRRQVRKKSRAELYRFLISFYGLTDVVRPKKTYEALFTEWVEYKKKFIGAPNSKKGLSSSTIRRYQRDYDAHIRGSELSKTDLEDITAVMIEEFFFRIIEEHTLTDRCAGNIFGYLNQSFDYAVRSGYLDMNPMIRVDRQLLLSRCSAPEITTDADHIFTKTQLAELRQELRRHEAACPGFMPDYAIELALLTGMRIGELAALQWSSIDDHFIHIDYSEHRLDFKDKPSEIVIGEPKNRKHRSIPLTAEMRRLFERIRETGNLSEEEFVFADKSGNRCTARSIGCAMNRRAKAIGIEHGSIHRIRRTVSSILNQTLPQKDVAELLGHTERVNEMHYHFSTADMKEKQSALNTLSDQMNGITVIKAG